MGNPLLPTRRSFNVMKGKEIIVNQLTTLGGGWSTPFATSSKWLHLPQKIAGWKPPLNSEMWGRFWLPKPPWKPAGFSLPFCVSLCFAKVAMQISNQESADCQYLPPEMANWNSWIMSNNHIHHPTPVSRFFPMVANTRRRYSPTSGISKPPTVVVSRPSPWHWTPLEMEEQPPKLTPLIQPWRLTRKKLYSTAQANCKGFKWPFWKPERCDREGQTASNPKQELCNGSPSWT